MVDTVAFNAAYKQALAAYNNAGSVAAPNNAGTSASEFSGFVGEALSNLSNSLQKAEKNSAKSTVGQADITDVVTSVGEAELALQTVIAVRDRAISAYQDIIKMPI
jgi:flagellar hook-basal body complex protein FliE